MKKSELKNIIKECVREVIFEEGMLSGIISEVVQGLGSRQSLQEASPLAKKQIDPATQKRLSETKKQMLDAVASSSYADFNNVF